MTAFERSLEVILIPIDEIEPCSIQPRVNISMELITKLSASIKAGRHEPLLEVEPAPGKPGRFQIVFGEQRWRAARAAGLVQVLVRLHPPLGYLERLEKQFEENHLRADLDPVEEAHCIFLDKTLRDIAVAEQLLRDASVRFQPLSDTRVINREGFPQHLDGLKQLLVQSGINVINLGGRRAAGSLSPWRDTEKALGISESARKAKVGILRIDAHLQEELRPLPAEHAIQIARLDDPRRQAELVKRASHLTHRQVQQAVERLRQDQEMTVDAALAEPHDVPSPESDPIACDVQLSRITDLCRQLVRILANLRSRLSTTERGRVRDVVADLRQALSAFDGGA
jgi:ParB-like chromosome segregation protein Spo0J